MNKFLDIEIKKDSAAKLAYAAGKPTENFLFAAEENKTVSSINTLRAMIPNIPGAIEQIISRSVGVNVGYTERMNVVNYINEWGANLATTGCLIMCETDYPVDETEVETVSEVYVFWGIPGEYGSNNFLNASDISLIWTSKDSIIPLKQYKTFRAKLTLNAGAWVPSERSVEEFSPQIWGDASQFTIKYFPDLTGSGEPWPENTHLTYSPTTRNGTVYHYTVVQDNSGFVFKCPTFNPAHGTSHMYVEISIPI